MYKITCFSLSILRNYPICLIFHLSLGLYKSGNMNVFLDRKKIRSRCWKNLRFVLTGPKPFKMEEGRGSGHIWLRVLPEYPGISLFVSPSFYIYYDTYTSLIIVNRMGEGHRSFGIWYSKTNPNFKNQPITCLTTYFCLK